MNFLSFLTAASQAPLVPAWWLEVSRVYVRTFPLEPTAKVTPSSGECNSVWHWLRRLAWLRSVGRFAVVWKSQGGDSACVHLGILQCGELRVKEEMAGLLQAKLRPGSELLSTASYLLKLITWPTQRQYEVTPLAIDSTW